MCKDKTRILSEWTLKHIVNKIPLQEWMPTESELTALGVELKMPLAKQNEQRALMQMFLSDEKYCKACAESGFKFKCYLDGKPKTIVVIDNNISFVERQCKKENEDAERNHPSF